MTYAEEAVRLLKLAEQNSRIQVKREEGNTQIEIAKVYASLAQLESNERMADDFNDYFNRKRFV